MDSCWSVQPLITPELIVTLRGARALNQMTKATPPQTMEASKY